MALFWAIPLCVFLVMVENSINKLVKTYALRAGDLFRANKRLENQTLDDYWAEQVTALAVQKFNTLHQQPGNKLPGRLSFIPAPQTSCLLSTYSL